MGVYIDSMDWQDCWMPAANEAAVLKAFARKRRKTDWIGGEKHDTIEELFDQGCLHGIGVKRDGDRIIFGLEYQREKMSHLTDAVTRLAPFMGGGTIFMQAEGEFWKWIFRNKRLLTYDGTIVYGDELCPAWLGPVEIHDDRL